VSRYVLTSKARADLFTIWEYISNDSVSAADKVISRIEKAFSQLADMPGNGHFRQDLLNQRFKFWTVYSFVIVYSWRTTPIRIIAVVHGARDLEAFFDERGDRE
jgi:antitoxin ParD1/3/4/toxin ParE1/3/4